VIDNLSDIAKSIESKKETKLPKGDSIKQMAQKAAQAAQKLMSDKRPAPIELGGVADKLPKKGGSVVISPPPLPAPPDGTPDLRGK
jgi:hypothetical protein